MCGNNNRKQPDGTLDKKEKSHKNTETTDGNGLFPKDLFPEDAFPEEVFPPDIFPK